VKIFISHSSRDYELAKTLKDILEESELIKNAFVYEDEKRLGTQISEKIINEIESSDYLVALITENSIQSASVNQEYGYAQAKNLQKIPFLEEGSEEGIMIYGAEKISFSKETFSERCLEVKKYLVDNGLPNKISNEESFFIQKSAHFRYELEQILASFIDSYLVRFVEEYTKDRGMFTKEQRIQGQQLFKNEIKNQDDFFRKIFKQTLGNIETIYENCNQFKTRYDKITRFPHTEFLPNEQDALIKLNERMQEILSDDLFTLLQELNREQSDLNVTLEEFVMQTKKNTKNVFEPSIYLMDLRFFLKSVESMFEILQKIHEKYGHLAFQSSYDDETV